MEQRNLIFAVIASMIILIGYNFLWEQPRQRARQAELERQAALTQQATPPAATGSGAQPAPGAAPAAPVAAGATLQDRAAVIARGQRVPIATPRLAGSVSLVGGRIDDLTLLDYHETVDRKSPNIVLLSPPGTPDAYYVDYGWVATDPAVKLPGPETVWQAPAGASLGVGQPLTLTWDNGAGLKFSRTYAIDDHYMFTVTQKVENGSATALSLFPYGRVLRTSAAKMAGVILLGGQSQGAVGVFDGTLRNSSFDSLKSSTSEKPTTGGWMGFTDIYWLVSIIPDQKMPVTGTFRSVTQNEHLGFQVDYRATQPIAVPPGGTAVSESRAFGGPKVVDLLVGYAESLGITKFDYAIDWVFFYLLTRPIFRVLDFLYGVVGNFGVAILLLTVSIKLLFLPLANRSYRAMSKMKALAPEMTKLRERYKEDKAKLNTEMMALYKREKVNPAAGCLPIVVQIPVFIALYSVLAVTIEMRHAPFFGWIRDLSAPDPTSILNLFGLLPWVIPDLSHLGPVHYINIGIWPIIMGVTMYLQQKLNPAPPDPVQARIFMLLPIIFTFMLGQFAAGLVIYWAWNNLLSIAQQRFIMWRMGVKA